MRVHPALPVCVVLVLVAAGALLMPGRAGAGEYTVAACDAANRAFAGAEFIRSSGGDYSHRKYCDRPREGNSLQIRNISGAPHGHRGAIRWAAPAGARVVGVRLEASLRRDSGHFARLGWFNSAGDDAGRIASGADEPGGFQPFDGEAASGRAGFQAELRCERADRCPASSQARTWIRSVRLSLRDERAPELRLGGSLLAGGWLRGFRTLEFGASDRGAGLRRLTTTVAGSPLQPSATFECATAGGGSLATALQPCEPEQTRSATLSTAARPFVDGTNRLRLCAADFGRDPNQTCAAREVLVDNLEPSATLGRPDPADPELIPARVDDAHSGPASASISFRPVGGGQWTRVPTALAGGSAGARIDSSSYPAGRYRFRVEATDVAGNRANGERLPDGSPLVLRFPLRSPARLTLKAAADGRGRKGKPRRHPYGRAIGVSGRLRLAGGADPGGLEVTVAERLEPGSDPRFRSRVVITDRRGRFSARLPAGPSRRIVARFKGSRRNLPAESRPARVAVLGESVLKLGKRRVRAGGRVRFTGRVGMAGARIPGRGKVLELQVREQGRRRFRTVRRALHSDRRGRVSTAYTFGRFYTRPERFEFRLRATPQARWPYRAPANSKPRTLVVVPR